MRRTSTIICLSLAFLAPGYGCATIPNGELQLGPKIVRDMHESRVTAKSLSKGRPIYIEARSYPQMLESGDIWAGGPVLLNLGREDLSLDALLPKAVEPEVKKETPKKREDKKS